MLSLMEHKRTMRRVLAASLIGSSIEWFDFFLYASVAGLVFNKLYFVTDDPTIALLLSYASFSLTFFIRPFGGIIFSHIGDRMGRKQTLVITLTIMGIATVGIGLLPTYYTIGIWAPLILISLRLVQGLGIGGEWGGALLLAVEYAPAKERGFYGSVPQMGIPIGMVMGTLVLALLSLLPDEDFMAWGWRVPFILSALLVIFGLWLRQELDETPIFKAVQQQKKIPKLPILTTFKYHWREVLITIGAKFVETGPFYIFSVFIVSYATNNLGYSRINALTAVMIATVVTTLLIPLMGKLSDRVGRIKLYTYGVIAMILYAFPYFWLIHQGSVRLLILGTVIGLGIIWAPITALLGTLFSEIFAPEIRYTGVSLGYQIGAALAGGSAPLIAIALLKVFDNRYEPIAFYIIFTAVISLVALYFMRGRTTHMDINQ